MTVSSIKVKVQRKALVKLKVLPKFPANVETLNFLTVTRSGNSYTFSVDYSVLTPGPILDPTTAYIAIEDATAGVYRTVALSSLLTSGLDADLQAIAALTGTGILARTAANTWVLRTIAGTANEITVTNGDGVSGAPTLSLPAALTFTGKTVTNGTFTGVTITSASYSGTLAGGTGLPISTGVSGLGTGIATALGVNVGTAGAPVINGGALGTPSSGTATNLSGTAAGLTAGNVTTNANLTGPVTSVGNATTIGANQVSRANLAQGIARSIIGVTGNATANVADIQGTANQALVINSAGTALAFGAVNLASSAGATGVIQAASFPALTGDVTTVAGALASTIAANAVTNAKMATMAANTVKANATGGSATPTDVTAATARTSSLLNIDQATPRGDAIYTILATDRTVITNATFTASRTWTLPAANALNAGQQLIVADMAGGVSATNTLVISRAGADTINGGTSVTIAAANGAYFLASDGTSKWTAQAFGASGGGGGVTSIAGNTGAFTLGTGLTNSVNVLQTSFTPGPHVIIEERQAAGTNGGAFNSGAWRTRALSTLAVNLGSIASLASNQFTLGAGTYFMKWDAPAFAVDNNQSRIQNITDSTTVAAGTSANANNPNSIPSMSSGSTEVTIGGSKTFELQHQCLTTKATNGFGVASNFGITEVYARVEITKIG